MRRSFLILPLFFCFGLTLFAQPDEGDNPRIQEMRVAFFEEELQFTPEESAAFWPVYQKYREDRKNLKSKYPMNKRMELMTDSEAEHFIDQHLELEEKELALKRTYINELKGVISIRKIAMINRTERKFKQALLNKIKDRQGNYQRRRGAN